MAAKGPVAACRLLGIGLKKQTLAVYLVSGICADPPRRRSMSAPANVVIAML